jgi:spermidine/putrescine-binding protein
MGRLPRAELPNVTKFLSGIVGQAKSLAPTAGDAAAQLGSRDAWAVFPGGAFIDAIAKSQGGSGVRTLSEIKGGTPVFLSLFAIPREADNADAAYAFVNYVLSPKINAYAADFIGQATIEPAAIPAVKTNRNAFPYATLGAFLKKAPIFFNPPVESDRYVTVPEWLAAWAKIKAGS